MDALDVPPLQEARRRGLDSTRRRGSARPPARARAAAGSARPRRLATRWRSCASKRKSVPAPASTVSLAGSRPRRLPSRTTSQAFSCTWWSPSAWPGSARSARRAPRRASGGRSGSGCRRASRARAGSSSARRRSYPAAGIGSPSLDSPPDGSVVDTYALGPTQTNCYVVRAGAGRRGGGRRRSGLRGDRADSSRRGDPRHALPLGPPGRDRRRSPGPPVRRCTCRSARRRCSRTPRPSTPAQQIAPYRRRRPARRRRHGRGRGPDLRDVEVPGHSPGHIAFATDGMLFSGDVLFAGSVGRTDLPFADWDTLVESIRLLLDRFPPETVVYPGHGPPTTLGAERGAQPLPRGAPRLLKFEAPRGTHDILPSDQPLWQRVTGEAERLCALYGYRRIVTPGFEDTELFVRTSGEGSDVVQKEMYTFQDRGGRSLTLRPEATAPICRAYLQHGMHREPQPVEALHPRPDVALRPAAEGPLPRALAALRRGDRLGRPRRRRGADPVLRRAASPPRRRATTSSSSTRSATRTAGPRTSSGSRPGSTSTTPSSTTRRARSAQTTPLRVFDVKSERVQAAPRRGAEDRREPLRRVPRALRAGPRLPRRGRRRVRARTDARPRARLLHAHDVRVQGRGDRRAELDLRRRPLRRADRGDRRAADAGDRLRRGDRAPAPLARRARAGAGGDRRLLRRGRRRRPHARSRKRSPSCAAGGSRRHGLRGPVGQGPADAGEPSQRAAEWSSSSRARRPDPDAIAKELEA